MIDHAITDAVKDATWTIINPLHGWCTREKSDALIDLVTVTRPQVVVEIGVFGGRSLIALGMALRRNGDGGMAYGIDPWRLEAALEGDVGAENHEWWKDKVDLHQIHRSCMEALWLNKLDEWCCVLRSTGEQAVRLFSDRTVDLFHQDSNHSDLVSCRQAHLWASKITDNGYWILDDADWTTQTNVVKLIPSLGFHYIGGTDKYFIFQRNAH